MIKLTVTSDSNERELRAASRLIDDLLSFRAEEHLSKTADILIDNDVASTYTHDVGSVNKVCGHYTPEEIKATFNTTELAEAEALGKPVCSTVGAEASKIAPEDMLETTLTPNPQIVFGQPAQTTENAVNPVAPATEGHVIDADGLMWDARIHSSSREMVKDGTWRKRRGVDSELVKQVETELRSRLNIELGVETEPTVAAIPTELGMQVFSTPEPRVPDPTPSAPMTFNELLDAVTKAMVNGQLTQARITEALQSIDVAALPHLIARADLIPAFRNALGGVV